MLSTIFFLYLMSINHYLFAEEVVTTVPSEANELWSDSGSKVEAFWKLWSAQQKQLWCVYRNVEVAKDHFQILLNLKQMQMQLEHALEGVASENKETLRKVIFTYFEKKDPSALDEGLSQVGEKIGNALGQDLILLAARGSSIAPKEDQMGKIDGKAGYVADHTPGLSLNLFSFVDLDMERIRNSGPMFLSQSLEVGSFLADAYRVEKYRLYEDGSNTLFVRIPVPYKTDEGKIVAYVLEPTEMTLDQFVEHKYITFCE